MIKLNVGIGSETETTGELNSGDLKNMTCKTWQLPALRFAQSGIGVSCV